MQLKLRDIEVANDDYEIQARNTTSSLEDLESKYNVSIERGVMLEEEIRAGEQEREELRIETQRLRDELSDLRVEADITREKLRTAEATIERLHDQKPLYLTTNNVLPRSPTSEVSRTTTSSPTLSTPPPPKSETSTNSGVPTPPSPPLSDASLNPRSSVKTPLLPKRRSFVPDLNTTPKPISNGSSRPRASRGPSFAAAHSNKHRMAPPSRPANMSTEGLPRSSSLYQIKGLIGRMQKIEERVHSVRSKLPPPNSTANPTTNTPRASPRPISGSGPSVPATITMRNSTRKRMSSSTASSTKLEESIRAGRLSTSHIKRLSFSASQAPQGIPTDQFSSSTSRPSSQASSRASETSHSTSSYSHARPPSRAAAPPARTPSSLGYHAPQPFVPARPRSSLGGTYASTQRRGHSQSMSISRTRDGGDAPTTPLTVRNVPLPDRSAIPTPSALKRQSGGFGMSVSGRRSSVAGQYYEESMPPPTETPRKLSDVGETY